ncbi:MAG: hypothetical protein RL701_6374, partial [Pseudomonadota bacterium]
MRIMPRLPTVVRAFVFGALSFALSLALVQLTWPATPTAHADAKREAAPDPLRSQLAQLRGKSALPASVFDSISLQLDIADRIHKGFSTQAQAFRARATRWLDDATQGRDPLQAARGQIVMRGYASPISQTMQGYAVYLPKNYDPAKSYPLMLVLHGGSANGNLFLGVVLGNNMNWKEYDQHLWDDFKPQYEPDWIVVAPDGFGHVM